MFDTLRGIRTPAWLTALVRALLEALAFAAVYGLGEVIAEGGLPDNVKVYAPIAIVVLRMLEGVADQIDPVKQRRRRAADVVS